MKRILVLLIALTAIACSKEGGTAKQEQALTEENQSTLLANQPPKRLTWSLERENINKRTRLWNDRNKISYIYLIDMGQILGYYAIKGKVSSVNSQITNPEQMRCRYGDSCVSVPSPAEDGSYGTNGDAVFFFTDTGIYAEWSGVYLLTDQILPLSVPNFAAP